MEAPKSVSLIVIKRIPVLRVGLAQSRFLLYQMALVVVPGQEIIDALAGLDEGLGVWVEQIKAGAITDSRVSLEGLCPVLVGNVPLPETVGVIGGIGIVIDSMKVVMDNRALMFSGIIKKLLGRGVGVRGELYGRSIGYKGREYGHFEGEVHCRLSLERREWHYLLYGG